MKTGAVISSVSRKAGGLFESVKNLCLTMARFPDLHVEVLSLKDDYTDADIATWRPLPVTVNTVRGPRIFGFSPHLYRVLITAELEIIHVHGLWMYPSLAVMRWAKASGKPYVISAHGMLDPWAVRNARWKKRLAGWLYENAHLRGAACLRALCAAEAEAIRAYGLRNPICIIPNGIDPPAATPAEPPPWQAALPDDAKVLFYLGRLHPKKGLPHLLRAWAAAHSASKHAEPWHLVIAGWDQGGHETELKAQTQQLGIQNRVHFVGPQFDAAKRASYRRADACILPSFSEGLPMTVLEAWSYGLPVLMTPQCNLPEGFQAQAALRIDPEPERIAQGLAALFALPDHERKAMGERGRALVAQRFTWPHIAQQMLAVYRWVLGWGDKPDCVITD